MKNNTQKSGWSLHVISAPLRCLVVVAAMLLSGLSTKAAAQTAAPRVTIDAQNAAISNVFEAIQVQTGYSVVYNTSDLNPSQTASLKVKDVALQAALDRLFAGSDITYTIKDKHIVLSKKAQPSSTVSGGGNIRYRNRR